MSPVDASAEQPVLDAAAQIKAERARRRKSADALGWKIIGHTTAEVRCERKLQFGPRTVVIRGRAAVPLPDEMTAEAGERAAAEIVDPAIEPFRLAMERAAVKILTEPDDVTQTHVFERSSFFTALEDARRGLVLQYQRRSKTNASMRRSTPNSVCASISRASRKNSARSNISSGRPTPARRTRRSKSCAHPAAGSISRRCDCWRSKCTSGSMISARRPRSSPAKSASSIRRRAT